MLAQAARWKAKNSPPRREPGNQRAELLQALRDKPTHCFFFCGTKCQDNAEQLCQRGRDGREGERQPSAPRFLEPATACVSSLESFFQGKKGGYPGPAPRQLCVSDTEHFVQPPRCRSVFAPCPGQQSPARDKGCWASREGKGWMARLRRFPRAAPDTAKVEGGTGML